MPPSGADRVAVPHLLGLEVKSARRLAHAAGIVLVSETLDGPSLGAQTWPGRWFVTSTTPRAGSEVERWANVVITFAQRGGGEAPVPVTTEPDASTPLRAAARPRSAKPAIDLG